MLYKNYNLVTSNSLKGKFAGKALDKSYNDGKNDRRHNAARSQRLIKYTTSQMEKLFVSLVLQSLQSNKMKGYIYVRVV